VAAIFLIVYLAIVVVVMAGVWKMFEKAGKPGWGCLIPIYNAYLLCEIGGKPGWWVVLMLIPFVNIAIMILVMLGVARNFGQGGGFAVGLILLGAVFMPILGYGQSKYVPGGAQPPGFGVIPNT
jgi:hypothetical protein